MNRHFLILIALIRKDLMGLLPLIVMAMATFLVVPVVANLDLLSLGGDQQFWLFLQSNIYWIGFFLGVLLMISVIQQDPADSVNHDWLTRPVRRWHSVVAKAGFMLLVFLLPVVLSRFLINLTQGMAPGLALSYASGIESLEATLLVPLILMTALLAPTLRKLILLLVAVFFVFLLPGWSATRPLLAAVGIELGGDFGPMMWLQGLTIVVACSVGAGLVYWFLYCRRQRLPATLSYWAAVVVMFLAVYPPEALYSWDQAVALHAWMINSDNSELEEQVILEPAVACFPAALVGNSATTEQENQLLAQAAWVPEIPGSTEAGALTFATPVRHREILTGWFKSAREEREHSVEWRLDRILTRARFTADSLAEDVPLRRSFTAHNRFHAMNATETDYWLVPADRVAQLAQDPSTQLVMDYDAALLAPTSFELPVDGQRYDFPGLGSCKAELRQANNEIRVECLQRGAQPDLVSAQFIGMDSSRVDSRSQGTYIHDWVEALRRRNYELTLPLPSLADTSTIMVTAFHAERLLHKQLVVPGMLGDDQAVCSLPQAATDDIERPSSWSDKSPHEISYVTVEPGVRLEVLDWRQALKPDAPTLLLLPGLGATGHSYDEIAPQLAQRYNVLGMTRRGTGDSGKPERGYDIARLSQDVLRVLDTFGIDSAVLVGHSFGGEELSFLGSRDGHRVDGLIYLDAAYDRVTVNAGDQARRFRQLGRRLPPEPPIRPSEAVSYAALQDYARRTGRAANIPEGEILASYDLTTGNIKHDSLYLDALMRGIVSPDYENIAVPALALYAVPGSPAVLMEGWYDADDPQLQAIVTELYEMDLVRKGEQMERFDSEVRDSRVVVLEDADHWIFVSHEDAVLQAMQEFVEEMRYAVETGASALPSN
ncbi:MAG: alpha/beta hydrolase [Gammaproteobacteria bacterium]